MHGAQSGTPARKRSLVGTRAPASRCWRATGACARARLDLIARRADTIVFCEVKTRRGDAFGQPFEAVTARKQARIRGLAMQWLAAADEHADVLRFDVASVRPDGRGDWLIELIEAAF